MTDKEAFEAWHGGVYRGQHADIAWAAWQAATLAERERCAKVCVETAKAYNDEGAHLIAHGAFRCADKIRELPDDKP